MSKGEVYVKGMNITDSDEAMSDGVIWDDELLIKSYDAALRIANTDVAKRIAMATNTSSKVNADKTKNRKISSSPTAEVSNQRRRSESKPVWQAGMTCRATYDRDGYEYEAIVMRIISEKDCIVKFFGYNNTEIVPIRTLKPSLGDEERKKQMLEATSDIDYSRERSGEESESDRASSSYTQDKPPRKKKYGKGRKDSFRSSHHDNPFPLPDFSNLRNMNLDSAKLMNPPPLPMDMDSGGNCSEEQALSSMLISWYMNGYYTGLYQGMKRGRHN